MASAGPLTAADAPAATDLRRGSLNGRSPSFHGSMMLTSAAKEILKASSTASSLKQFGKKSRVAMDEEKKADLKYFFPSVIRRVRTRRRAKTDWRVRALLVFEDRTFSTAASVMHVFIVLATVASTVILVGFVQDADMEAVARSSSGAGAEGGSEGRDLAWSGSATDFVDFGLSVLLAADWLARCLIHCALRLRRGSSVAAADTTWLDQGGIQGTSWLLVDGVASASHLAATSLVLCGRMGSRGGVYNEMLSCGRLLRLASLARQLVDTAVCPVRGQRPICPPGASGSSGRSSYAPSSAAWASGRPAERSGARPGPPQS